MGTKNLYNKEAQEKIAELVNDIDFCMMATGLTKKPFGAIPMSTKKVDDHGKIWFLSNANSDHNKNLEMDQDIQLIYSDPSDMEFLSLYGQAMITRDQSIIDELYGKADDNWFNGKNDPNITAICVSPKEAYYWDTKSNKLVTLFKMGVGAITGEKQDIGEKGKLEV
ncbi:MAG: pyridoxamine 5'-phosphate oxidase family protein [Leeuwenhoekiella sp.]